MADIRIKNLTEDDTPEETHFLAIDDDTGTRKVSVADFRTEMFAAGALTIAQLQAAVSDATLVINPLSATLDAGGQDIEGVAALTAETVALDGGSNGLLITERGTDFPDGGGEGSAVAGILYVYAKADGLYVNADGLGPARLTTTADPAASDLQDVYDGGAGVAVATGTPVALDTSGAASPATQEAITVTDGTDTMSVLGRQILGADGTTGNPTYGFAGSAGDGMYLFSNNNVSIAAASAEIVRFRSTGGTLFVGTGTEGSPIIQINSASAGLYRQGGSIALVGAGAEGLRTQGVVNAATGDEIGTRIFLEVNKLTSGSYTALTIEATETSAPGADNRLLDLRVGGTSQFHVDNSGELSITSAGHRIGGVSLELESATSQVVFSANGLERGRFVGSTFRCQGAGTAANVSIGVGGANSEGLFEPAANQLGLAANGEAVIVDNDSATPSFRPDADDTWTIGEAALRWSTVYSTTLDTGDVRLRSPEWSDVSYTLVEGRDGLYLRDHRTGKAFRLAMEEVPVEEAPRTREELVAAGAERVTPAMRKAVSS